MAHSKRGFMNKIITNAVLLLCTLFITAGCSTTMQTRDVASAPHARLLRAQTVAITPVGDGMFNGKIYPGSGANVANMFAVNLRPYISKSLTGGPEQDLAAYYKAGAYYVVKPTILHWEPRAAAWSGVPTRLKIHVSVYTAADGKEIISKNLEVTGRRATLVSQSIEALSEMIIAQFCAEIFA